MRTHPSPIRILTLPAVAFVAAACGETPSDVSHANLHGQVETRGAGAWAGSLKALHSATARFHSTVQATKAGYVEDSPCVASPGLGTMGFHWVNHDLVDPVFEPLKPEAVLYAPNGNGKLKLVAVEYIVINTGQPAPAFDGHPFDVGGTPVPVAHWSLHVWIHKDNPNGIFTPFNPTISCSP